MSTATRLPRIRPKERLRGAVRELLVALGEQPEREGLLKTPTRVARALSFLTSGHTRSPRQILEGAVFDEPYDGVVLLRDIEFYSLCEHHLLPFEGRVHIAYVPDGRIVGLSKLPRLVEAFARRLQVQERLTVQIADALQEVLAPRGVAVLIEARHFCMLMRGVEKQHCSTSTSALRGVYRHDNGLLGAFLGALGAGGAGLHEPRLANRALHGSCATME
jgi:GTP cyclohydrolase I